MLERIFRRSKLPLEGRISVIYSSLQDSFPEGYRCEASKRDVLKENLKLPEELEEFLFPDGHKEVERVLVVCGTDGLTWVGIYNESRRVRFISREKELFVVREDLEREEVFVEDCLDHKKVDIFLSSIEEELNIS